MRDNTYPVPATVQGVGSSSELRLGEKSGSRAKDFIRALELSNFTFQLFKSLSIARRSAASKSLIDL